jgi:hypothetical protein
MYILSMLIERLVNNNSWPKQENDIMQGAGWLAKNDVTHWQAGSTGLLPDQKSKQNLSLYSGNVLVKMIRLIGGGLALSSQTVGPLLRAPWLANPDRKLIRA